LADIASIYIERGRAFLDAADTLIAAKATTADASYHPLATLLLFSIEISLKAALLSKGVPAKKGHEIDRYLIDATAVGLPVSEEIAAGVFGLAEPYRLHGPRYAPIERATISMPPIAIMRDLASCIVDLCATLINGGNYQTPFQPLTGAEAEALRDRVAAAYQAQVDAFDPSRVYTEQDKPDIPLGMRTITKVSRP